MTSQPEEEGILTRALQATITDVKPEAKQRAVEAIAKNTTDFFSKNAPEAAAQAVSRTLRNVENKYLQSTASTARLNGMLIMRAIATGLPKSEVVDENVRFVLLRSFDSFKDIDKSVRTCALELCLALLVKYGKFVINNLFVELFTALSVSVLSEKDKNNNAVVQEIGACIKQQLSNSNAYHVEDSVLVGLINQITDPLVKRGSANYATQWAFEWVQFWLELPENAIITQLPSFIASIVAAHAAFQSEYVFRSLETCRKGYRDYIQGSGTETNAAKLCETLANCVRLYQTSRSRKFCLEWMAELFSSGKTQTALGDVDALITATLLEQSDSPDTEIRNSAVQASKAMLVAFEEEKLFSPSSKLLQVVLSCLSHGTTEDTKLGALDLVLVVASRSRPAASSEVALIFEELVAEVFSPMRKVREKALHVIAEVADESRLTELCKETLQAVFDCPDDLFQYLPETIIGLQQRFGTRTETSPPLLMVTISEILVNYDDFRFVNKCVLLLNSVLTTAENFSALREAIKRSNEDDAQDKLFSTLFSCWNCNAISTIALCLLGRRYGLALELSRFISEQEPSPSTLLLLDRLVFVLELPSFSFLRMDLVSYDTSEVLLELFQIFAMMLPLDSYGQKILRERISLCGKIDFGDTKREKISKNSCPSSFFNEFVEKQHALQSYESRLLRL